MKNGEIYLSYTTGKTKRTAWSLAIKDINTCLIKYQGCIFFVEQKAIKHRTPFRFNDWVACEAEEGSAFLYTTKGDVCLSSRETYSRR